MLERFAFDVRVENEFVRAVKANDRFNSSHEAYAVILEEVDELWDEIRKKPSERSRDNMLTELVQIAAMCRRMAVDLNLI